MRRGGSLSRKRLAIAVALLCILCATALIARPKWARAGDPRLERAAASDTMVWNGVAVWKGRVFVSGPRWTGSKGPAVGTIDGDRVAPFPDAAWNGWWPGDDPARAFVNVNAIHLDDGGGLWVVDTGTPDFGGDPLPGGAKLVRIDLAGGRVSRIYPAGPAIALPGSYIDDIRINGGHAYLTDAGRPGLIVLDIASGAMRRVLDGHPSVTASEDRDILLSGRVLKGRDGRPVRVHSDPMEISPDGRWFHYAPLEGPWSRIETRFLDDPSLSEAELASHVEPWADIPPVGGTAMDKDGSLYFTDLAANALRRRAPDGTIDTIVSDDRLHWADAPFIDADRRIWLPVPQIDRSDIFSNADGPRQWPVGLYRLKLRD